MRVLVINAGSSSLKLRLVGPDDRVVWSADFGDETSDALAEAIDEVGRPEAVGHRVVHGGERFREAVVVTPQIRQALDDLADLAPLHQARSLKAMARVSDALPGVPAVACFDTAFHATISPAASTYAIPREWRHRYGIRRFGFHGLSHDWATRRAQAMLGRDDLHLVICHLGSGSSLAAVRDGRSVDTTMGFTPLEGLVMATRSGTIDPGILLWLEKHGVAFGDVAGSLEHRSGLQALAGTQDMREVLELAASGNSEARLALDVYGHRLRIGIGAMAVAAGGLDALVFTGGVGENAAEVRLLACTGLEFMGVSLDEDRNASAEPDADVSGRGTEVRTLVVASREELVIAAEARRLLN